MINFDDYTNGNKTEHNSKWQYILDHPYRTLITGSSGWGKINYFLNLRIHQNDSDDDVIDKTYLYVKDPFEVKYQYLINKREKVDLNHYDDPKDFAEYSK